MSIRKGKTIIAGSAGSLDWTGTLEEYNIAIENGIIQPDWICYITDDTLYTDDIRPEIETLNSVKANKDLSNLSEVGEKHFLNKSQITNCITEIPQRIKYTLVDETLTIKAGTVVIVPYGVEDLTAQYPVGATFLNDNFKVYDTQYADGKFFVWAEVQSDISHSITVGTAKGALIFTVGLENSIQYRESTSIFSGSNDTMAQGTTYYQIENNVVISHNISGLDIQVSLPVFIGGITNNTIVSIPQVFNGMGYIGSTVWVDKGVKGLIPNGRNEDGTLRNIEYTSDKILMRTFDSAVIGDINIQLTPEGTLSYSYGYIEQNSTPSKPTNGQLWFNVARNTMRRWISTTTDWSNAQNLITMVVGWGTVESGKITRFNPKITFKAIDYSDKSEISGYGMPSGKYIDLTLGASGSTYIAPANGWFYLDVNVEANGYIIISLIDENDNTIFRDGDQRTNKGELIANMPCLKGQVVKIAHAAISQTARFYFVYAEGEV